MSLPEKSEPVQPRLMEELLASLPEAVVVERGHRVVFVNAAFTRIFGFTAEEVRGEDLRNLIVPDSHAKENAQLAKELAEFGFASLDTVRKKKDGDLVDVALEARPLGTGGAGDGLVYSYRDIGDRKRIEAKLQHDALHDPLTGLPNRALFLDRLKLAFSRRARSRSQNCGLLFLDLDRFKEVNDTMGHAVGDALLVA
ncbi:MAG: diguanylate cyclase, partial [Terracidiphilus sp.]